VILGKTNLSEWANFRSTHSSSGWSGRGGQSRNPHALDRSTSGSSSGSASAAAASFCAAAIGTETDGSIVSPSSCCGVVGIKPTLGLLSRAGIIPIAHSQDTAGPIARSVADAAALLSVLTGVDPRDSATADSKGHVSTDYTKYLDVDGLRGARIGILRSDKLHFEPKLDPILNAAVDAMRDRGAVIVDPVEMATLGQFDDSEFEVLLYEFKADLNAYLASLGAAAPVRSLADLIEYDKAHPAQEMPYFGQEILLMAEKKGGLDSKEYKDALAKDLELSRTKGIDATLKANKLDAIVALTNGPAHLIDLVNGDSFSGSSSSPAAVAGYPTVTVPGGFVLGLPVGISFIGTAWTEPQLIRYAYAFEQATKARRAPAFAPHAAIPEDAFLRQA
ncbi:MAG: amidase, partial [Thermoanaerobaculia bacterium]